MKRLQKWWREKVVPLWKKCKPFLPFVLLMIFFIVEPIVVAPNNSKPKTMPISMVQADLTAHKVKSVELNDADHEATVKLAGGRKYVVAYPVDYGDDLLNRIQDSDVPVNVTGKGFFERYQLAVVAVVVVMTALLYLALRQGPLRGRLTKANTNVSIAAAQHPKERFSDVGGADEVIAAFRQDVDALRHPERYREFGVKPTEGTLLYGPSGTGKTLLARAIAGEAGVPFFAMKGSDFMGRYLNDGPRAVREVFEAARKVAPSIVSIDEIDSIASKRSGNDDSGSKELNNLLNELLAQLDGFGQQGQTVLVIGATNRPDDLDPAIKRPGRLTRHADMPSPDREGRHKILTLHTAPPKKLADDVDIDRLVRMTSGMTGAELAALANQAGLLALAENIDARCITMAHFMDALATAEMGLARKSRQVQERDREITAIHEGGHALAALFTPDAPTPSRVTIIPRGSSGGHMGMHDEDWLFLTTGQLHARLVVAMAGRASEKLLLNGDYTTGAEADIAYATKLATYMVCQVGMSDVYTAQVPLGSSGHDPRVAQVTDEIDKLVKRAEADAFATLTEHQKALESLREQLLIVETLDGDKLRQQYTADLS